MARETFLVAYRDWGRVSGLDNPRAWVRGSPRTSEARPVVPEECLDATELADEVISRLDRNQHDNALALQDYSVASQACRREAAR